METRFALSVGQVNRYIKELLAVDDILSDLWVRGEVSNLTRHSSGHVYFTLKDAECQIRCVMWREDALRVRFPMEHGVQVIASGSVGVYEKTGVYQLYVSHLEPDGQGELHLAYERLRARLQREGLFDEERKRPLPYLPRRIALVTSPVGAALQDMLRILRDRHPRVDILVVPALVQGDLAPESLVQALGIAARVEGVDVIVLGRGGGSQEDLWAFNDEKVIRAISRCPVPVVSAVGHESDVTLADFVADCRCPTPSAAAQTVVPDWWELRSQVRDLLDRATHQVRRRVRDDRERLACAIERSVLERPEQMVSPRREQVKVLRQRLEERMRDTLSECRNRSSGLLGQLDALSPLGILSRGYSFFTHSRNGGRPVSSVDQVELGEMGQVWLRDGRLECRVIGKESTGWNPQSRQ